MKSWQTTSAGILAAVTLLIAAVQPLVDGNPETLFSIEQFMQALAGLGIGWFGVAARDNKVSSEKAGAR